MPDFETILVCALIPVAYVVVYLAGKYDLLGQIIQILQEKTASLTDDFDKVIRCNKCKYCDPENLHCDHPMGTALPTPRKPDDFCSYGEGRPGDA